jgi:DNA modification methylase
VDGVLEKAARRARGRLAVLDPFAGVGTTLVEALKNGHDAIGFEINPYAALASKTKVAASQYDVGLLQRKIALFRKHMSGAQRPQSGPPGGFASRVPFFSPSVERQVLRCIDFVNRQEMEWVRDLFRVAVGSVLVSFSNYSYEPSLGTRVAAGKGNVENADVGDIVVKKLEDMLKDIAYFQRVISEFSPKPRAQVLCGSFFDLAGKVAPQSIDVLITSPPYLNNYHYIRNTRPQMFWLGMISAPADLKEMEQKSFGQFWQTVRTGPPVNLEANMPGLSQLVEELRNRNLERGPYGGPGWANYAASYFNDCARFCRLALALMKPSGTAVIVIGNNILQGIEFPTDKFFAQIAEAAGFEIVELHEVRRKRTGSSIVNSSVRAGIVKQRTLLYETAIELRAAGATKVISSRLQ